MDTPTLDSAAASELREVLAYYDLGELVDFEKNERGFVNTAYAIRVRTAGQEKLYFMRKYKHGIGEEELLFEHSLIEHLVSAGSPVARIHHTLSGSTYLHTLDTSDPVCGTFYTIFEYLPGEDRFSWVDPILSAEQIADSARVLAQFHLDAINFRPRGARVEPKILELLPVIAETWSGCPARSKRTVFDARILEMLDIARANIETTIRRLNEPGARALPEMVIHCDYHPGNLKFSGDRVTGVFDFDWSKFDLRLFDVGLALWYFCAAWSGAEDGALRLDAARMFLNEYQWLMAHRPGGAPITAEEALYLPTMINAGNLYVMHWTVMDFFAKDVDPVEYLIFLDHSLHFIEWYERAENRKALQDTIDACL